MNDASPEAFELVVSVETLIDEVLLQHVQQLLWRLAARDSKLSLWLGCLVSLHCFNWVAGWFADERLLHLRRGEHFNSRHAWLVLLPCQQNVASFVLMNFHGAFDPLTCKTAMKFHVLAVKLAQERTLRHLKSRKRH